MGKHLHFLTAFLLTLSCALLVQSTFAQNNEIPTTERLLQKPGNIPTITPADGSVTPVLYKSDDQVFRCEQLADGSIVVR